MCAAEWGRKEIVKMLLQSPNVDASLTDCVRLFLLIRVSRILWLLLTLGKFCYIIFPFQDNQTALSIAIEQKHKAIALLIYAHLNFTRLESGEHSTV